MIEFHGTTISSDSGLLVCRELDEALGLTAALEDVIDEPLLRPCGLKRAIFLDPNLSKNFGTLPQVSRSIQNRNRMPFLYIES
ncbi:hypothetical protein IH922_07400 [candidate division KSB1 bacterium]|nr:hypothetical protein [candidate division KSB1 bacterium]